MISEYDEAHEAKATKPPATVIEITERAVDRGEGYRRVRDRCLDTVPPEKTPGSRGSK